MARIRHLAITTDDPEKVAAFYVAAFDMKECVMRACWRSFVVAGLVLADRIFAFALLLPFVLAGLWAGNRMHLTMSRERVLAAIAMLLIVTGASLLVRVFLAA